MMDFQLLRAAEEMVKSANEEKDKGERIILNYF